MSMHLFDVHVPMLFIQGTRDRLTESQLLEPVVKRLGKYASLHQLQYVIGLDWRDGRVTAALAGSPEKEEKTICGRTAAQTAP
jgi:hypothetical protein